jgi:glycerophosphoryl diester phosphodiesterase
MKIWAHRGCSQRYPENTLLAFEKAMQIKGLTGIELDIQLTKDNHMVVIYDEKVNRTTNGCGNVQDFTLEEIRRLKCRKGQRIPTIEEVLDLLEPAMRDGLMLNIELKKRCLPI